MRLESKKRKRKIRKKKRKRKRKRKDHICIKPSGPKTRNSPLKNLK
jgi:hypothetical protein